MELDNELRDILDKEREHRQKVDPNIRFYHPSLYHYDVKYRHPDSVAFSTLPFGAIPIPGDRYKIPIPSHRLRQRLKPEITPTPDIEPEEDVDDVRKEFYDNLTDPPEDDDDTPIVPLKHHQVIHGTSKPKKATITRLTDDQLKRARLVEASKIAYKENNEKAQEYLNENNMSDYKIIEELSNANQAGLVVENPKGNVEIAYRGTDVKNATDLIDDAKILTGREKHAIAEQQVKTIQGEGYNIEHITGFSLGGNKAINISSKFDIPSTSFNSGIGPKILKSKLNNTHTLIKTTEDPISMLGEVPKSNLKVEYIDPLNDSLNPIEAHKLVNFTSDGERRDDKRFQLQENINNAETMVELDNAITEYNNYNKHHTRTQGKFTKNKFIKTIHPTTTVRTLAAGKIAGEITKNMPEGTGKTATTGAIAGALVSSPKTIKQATASGALGAVVGEQVEKGLTKDLQNDPTISKEHKEYVASALAGGSAGLTSELAFLGLSGEAGEAALLANPESIPIAIAAGLGLGLISRAVQGVKTESKPTAPPPPVIKPTFIPR